MIQYKAMDYDKREVLTIQLSEGQPMMGCAKVLNHLDVEIGFDKVTIIFDEHTETYEAHIKIKNELRIATIIDIKHIGS